MLFLLNNRLVELDVPEMRLARRWRVLGCGEPDRLQPAEALDFVQAVIDSHWYDGDEMDGDLRADLCALIVSVTGANAALFAEGHSEKIAPRLMVLEENVLQAIQVQMQVEKVPVVTGIAHIWKGAA